MALDPVTEVLTLGNSLIERLVPDKAAQAQAKAQLVQMQLQGEFTEIQGQLEINKVEAASNSIWVSGWRPAVGWVCATALAFDSVLRPFVNWSTAILRHPINAAPLDMSTLIPLLGGLLGFGVMRSYDKAQGTDNGH